MSVLAALSEQPPPVITGFKTGGCEIAGSGWQTLPVTVPLQKVQMLGDPLQVYCGSIWQDEQPSPLLLLPSSQSSSGESTMPSPHPEMGVQTLGDPTHS